MRATRYFSWLAMLLALASSSFAIPTFPQPNVHIVRGSGLGGGIGSTLYSDRGSTSEFFTYDALGSTVALTDPSGLMTKSDLYEAFGSIASTWGTSSNNRLSHTKERDLSLGLDNHGMRYYDPTIGRYITRDPLGYGDGLNNYLYVGNNPVNHVDPQGLIVGEMLSWAADFIDRYTQNTPSPSVAAAGSMASSACRTAADFDPGYQTKLRVEHTVATARQQGMVAAVKQSVGESYEQVKEGVGTTDWVRGVDYENQYSKGERAIYFLSAASKTFLTVLGGVRITALSPGSTEGVTAGKTIANPVPSTMARVIPKGIPATTLGRPGEADVMVTAADDIAGMNAAQVTERLRIPPSQTGFKIIKFPTPQSGVASPVFRSDPGFVGGGLTGGGAREFVIPNQPIPPDATITGVQ